MYTFRFSARNTQFTAVAYIYEARDREVDKIVQERSL